MDTKKKAFVLASLRRASYRWHGRYTAFNKSKIGRNQYVCNKCKQVKGRKDVALDHIMPIVPITGWDNWDNLIDRLFCDELGFQVLCKVPCHKEKTTEENLNRKIHKKAKKELAKE